MGRKELLRAYKETPRPMGVYAVRNTADNKLLIGSSVNLPGTLNRHRFDLENGTHRVGDLQADWNRLGGGAFDFEVLDTLEPPEDPGSDPADDLATLVEMWTAKLELAGVALYAQP